MRMRGMIFIRCSRLAVHFLYNYICNGSQYSAQRSGRADGRNVITKTYAAVQLPGSRYTKENIAQRIKLQVVFSLELN